MKKAGNKLLFCGLVMIVGPFFGFTVRGQQDTDYSTGVVLGIIAIAIGLLLSSVGKENNDDENK